MQNCAPAPAQPAGSHGDDCLCDEAPLPDCPPHMPVRVASHLVGPFPSLVSFPLLCPIRYRAFRPPAQRLVPLASTLVHYLARPPSRGARMRPCSSAPSRPESVCFASASVRDCHAVLVRYASFLRRCGLRVVCCPDPYRYTWRPCRFNVNVGCVAARLAPCVRVRCSSSAQRFRRRFISIFPLSFLHICIR